MEHSADFFQVFGGASKNNCIVFHRRTQERNATVYNDKIYYTFEIYL